MSAFISYSHLDRPFAIRFRKSLQAFGLQYWWDDQIGLSAPWSAELEHRLAASTAIVVLWTPNSTHSEWVRREAAFAVSESKLVQVLIGQADLPAEFAHLQAASVPVWEENTFPLGIRRSLNTIARLQSKAPVLDEYAHIRRLKLSGDGIMRFVDEKKHHEGYFPKLDGPLFKDLWEMLRAGDIKLYDELHPGARSHMDEERYYELVEYLSAPLQPVG